MISNMDPSNSQIPQTHLFSASDSLFIALFLPFGQTSFEMQHVFGILWTISPLLQKENVTLLEIWEIVTFKKFSHSQILNFSHMSNKSVVII